MSYETKIQFITDSMSRKLADSSYERRFKDFNRTILFDIEDIGEKYIVKVENLKATIKQGTVEDPDISIIATCQIVDEIINGEVDAISAVMSKGLRVKGNMADILDLKKLISISQTF
ncbi:MAG: SCP2 sterol-binding domain-containing protein [Promethearchaeota archaeon]